MKKIFMTNSIFQFEQQFPEYDVPVLNERAVRASAGIAPSLTIGQWFVRKQQAEYVGAPQKRFAWAIGFVLALAMLYLMVLNNVIGPINMIVCSICLILLFFETAFGICIGCKVYNRFHKEKAQLCPGGRCEAPLGKRSAISLAQIITLLLFVGMGGTVTRWVYSTGLQKRSPVPQSAITSPAAPIDPAEVERCKVPDFAKALGHQDKWKQHNNCQ